MPEKESADALLDASYEEFVKSWISRYNDHRVKIKIGAKTYDASRSLLSSQSTYFEAMFEGKFNEAEDQTTHLELIDGVVTNRSFEMLLQWLYLGYVTPADEDPADLITSMIELARLADMLGVQRIQVEIEGHIRDTIKDNPPPNQQYPKGTCSRHPERNAYYITPASLAAAGHLPQEHCVRQLLATAVIESYMNCDEFKFWEELREVPALAMDILVELKETLESLRYIDAESKYYFTDNFSDKEISLRR